MLNILITFAQYEREVITERVRDKMSASRKKGKWVGGRVPMGYRVENKKLTIVEEEARIIQRIFQRFISAIHRGSVSGTDCPGTQQRRDSNQAGKNLEQTAYLSDSEQPYLRW